MRRHWTGVWLLAVATVASILGSTAGPASAKGSASGLKGTVVGSVTTQKGKPIDGADVTIESEGVKPLTAKTNAKGEYTIAGVPVGDAKVRIKARGYFAFEEAVVVAGKGATTVHAALSVGVLFAGVAKDERGKPVAGAQVRPIRVLQSDEIPDLGDFLGSADKSVTTDAEGRFTVEDLPQAKSYTLEFRHPHHVLGKLEGLAGKGGAPKEGLSIELKDAAWATGVVVDGAGNPIAGARVFGPDAAGAAIAPRTTYDVEQEKKLGSDSFLGSSWRRLTTESVVRTDEHGAFVFGGIEGEAAALVIDADGYFLATLALTELKPGEEKAGARVTLEPTVATLEGWLTDAAGKPVRYGHVQLVTAEGEPAADGGADDSGHFVFPKVRAKGPVRLKASGYRVVDTVVEGVQLDQKAFRVKMAASPRIQVKVVDAAGMVIRDVYVRIETAGDESSRKSTSGRWEQQEAGGFDLDVPVGEVTIRFVAKGTEWKTTASTTTKGGKVYSLPPLVLEPKGP